MKRGRSFTHNTEFYCVSTFSEIMEKLGADLVLKDPISRSSIYSINGVVIKFGDRYYKDPKSTELLLEFKYVLYSNEEETMDNFEKLIFQEEEKF